MEPKDEEPRMSDAPAHEGPVINEWGSDEDTPQIVADIGRVTQKMRRCLEDAGVRS